MAKEIKNLGASVRARLLKHAKDTGQDFQNLLPRYALERFLYRLSASLHADRYILKGAMLLITWLDQPHRPTRDLDLLGYGNPDPGDTLTSFREILAMDVADGLTFLDDTIELLPIREDLEYGGHRLNAVALLDGARIKLTIDIAFGDATEPGVQTIEYPSMLDAPKPRLRAYAQETVIAEKFQAMVFLGEANSRMKDFYDVWTLQRHFEFDGDRLAKAIAATFKRRGTAIPASLTHALPADFANSEPKIRQWMAFVRNVAIDPGAFSVVVGDIDVFLQPHIDRARKIME